MDAANANPVQPADPLLPDRSCNNVGARPVRKKRWRIVLAAVGLIAAAAAAGYVVGQSALTRPGSASHAPASEGNVYTCSMHPEVRLDRPGKCPLCGMPLVPAKGGGGPARDDPRFLQLSEHALAMASVETAPVTRRELSHELRTVGKVQYNESSLATVTARVDGYAERLFVNFTGVQIRAGDHLAEVYSPALQVTQGNLLLAVRDRLKDDVELTKARLKHWGLTDAQVRDLAENKKVAERITLVSPISGTVIEKLIVENSAFKAGDPLYRVANLDTVWVYLDVYEYDLRWVRFGQQVELTSEALPGQVISGMVTFVQPVLNEETRTVRVPVHVDNKGHALKPGMFVSALVRARLGPDGRAAPTGVEGRFSCVMHPQVLRDEPGPCPECDMPLERVPGSAASAAQEQPPLPLAVPATAVLDTGTRQIVYVERSRGLFEPREVVVGPRGGEWVPVLNGLADGDRVVTRGGLLIDSQFQIAGRPSLFYPGGAAAAAGTVAHRHGADQPRTPVEATAPPAASAVPPPAGAHRH